MACLHVLFLLNEAADPFSESASPFCRTLRRYKRFQQELADPSAPGVKEYRQSVRKNKFPAVFLPHYMPLYNCPDEEKFGSFVDGGKWVCGIGRIPKQDCVVYSVGSHGEDSFEKELKEGLL